MTIPSTLDLPKRLDSIQALRGIAALLVLFFHVAEFQRQMAVGNAADIALVSGIWDRGWAGVDLFFIISGFIMVYVTRQTGRSFEDVRRFMTSRITRIYPLWWVCAGIMAAYFWISYGMPAAPDRVSGPDEAFEFAAKSLLLIPQDVPPLLGLGWTLIHEMFFYIVFAGILFLPRKYLPPVLVLWAMTTLIGFLLIRPNDISYLTTGLIFSPYSLEFIAGGFAGYFVTQGKFFVTKILFFLGLGLACLGFVFFPQTTDTSHTVWRVAFFTIPFFLLTYGGVSSELEGGLNVPKWLVTLGNWSYSLYLTHYIVLVALRRLYKIFLPERFHVGVAGIWDNVTFALLALLISTLTASVFYNFIERPSLNFFKKLKT